MISVETLVKENAEACLFIMHSLADTTSQFHGKRKKFSWGAWNSFPAVTEAFHATEHPFQLLSNALLLTTF